MIPFAATITPTNPAQVFTDPGASAGLKLLHQAGTIPEADFLKQVLAEAGFQIEHVPSPGTGVFGIMGNSSIYVRSEEFEEARKFLNDYLDAEPLPEE